MAIPTDIYVLEVGFLNTQNPLERDYLPRVLDKGDLKIFSRDILNDTDITVFGENRCGLAITQAEQHINTYIQCEGTATGAYATIYHNVVMLKDISDIKDITADRLDEMTQLEPIYCTYILEGDDSPVVTLTSTNFDKKVGKEMTSQLKAIGFGVEN